MIPRRDALALLGGLVASACGASRRDLPAAAPEPTFALDPVVDLVPAAGLVWLVDARPRELFENAAIAPAMATIVPDERVRAIARLYGAVDVRRAGQIAVAGFADSFLGIARVPVEPAAVEAAFAAGGDVAEREVEHGVTRFRATAGARPKRVAVFGRDGAAIEQGRPGPLQAAIYFAEGKLKRALPALRADPLAAASSRIADAPLRAFAPGPFEGELARGLGGLLGAATALAAGMRPVEAKARPGTAAVAVTLLLLGAWGADAPAAEERLGAAFHLLSEDPLGRLTGVNRPIDAPRTASDPGALRLDVVLDLASLTRGLRDATDATVAEIMGS